MVVGKEEGKPNTCRNQQRRADCLFQAFSGFMRLAATCGPLGAGATGLLAAKRVL